EAARAAERARAATAAEAAERPLATVVLLALVGVAERVVGGRDLLEARLGVGIAGVAVGVVLARELAVGLLDLILRGLAVDAERLVVVGAPSHLRRHHHARGTQDRPVDPVALLVDRGHRAGLDALDRLLAHGRVLGGVA